MPLAPPRASTQRAAPSERVERSYKFKGPLPKPSPLTAVPCAAAVDAWFARHSKLDYRSYLAYKHTLINAVELFDPTEKSPPVVYFPKQHEIIHGTHKERRYHIRRAYLAAGYELPVREKPDLDTLMTRDLLMSRDKDDEWLKNIKEHKGKTKQIRVPRAKLDKLKKGTPQEKARAMNLEKQYDQEDEAQKQANLERQQKAYEAKNLKDIPLAKRSTSKKESVADRAAAVRSRLWRQREIKKNTVSLDQDSLHWNPDLKAAIKQVKKGEGDLGRRELKKRLATIRFICKKEGVKCLLDVKPQATETEELFLFCADLWNLYRSTKDWSWTGFCLNMGSFLLRYREAIELAGKGVVHALYVLGQRIRDTGEIVAQGLNAEVTINQLQGMLESGIGMNGEELTDSELDDIEERFWHHWDAISARDDVSVVSSVLTQHSPRADPWDGSFDEVLESDSLMDCETESCSEDWESDDFGMPELYDSDDEFADVHAQGHDEETWSDTLVNGLTIIIEWLVKIPGHLVTVPGHVLTLLKTGASAVRDSSTLHQFLLSSIQYVLGWARAQLGFGFWRDDVKDYTETMYPILDSEVNDKSSRATLNGYKQAFMDFSRYVTERKGWVDYYHLKKRLETYRLKYNAVLRAQVETDKRFEQFNAEMEETLTDFDKLKDVTNFTYDQAKRMMAHYNLLNLYSNTMRSYADTAPHYSAVTVARGWFEQHMPSLESALRPSGERTAPIGIYMEGAAGLGKTMLQNLLVKTLAAVYFPEYKGNVAYYHNSRDQYQESYYGQPIIVISDAFNTDDKPVNTLEIDFIQKALDSAVHKVVKAALAEKQRIDLANVKFVLVGSNWPLDRLTAKGASNQGAQTRRFNYHVKLVGPSGAQNTGGKVDLDWWKDHKIEINVTVGGATQKMSAQELIYSVLDYFRDREPTNYDIAVDSVVSDYHQRDEPKGKAKDQAESFSSLEYQGKLLFPTEPNILDSEVKPQGIFDNYYLDKVDGHWVVVSSPKGLFSSTWRVLGIPMSSEGKLPEDYAPTDDVLEAILRVKTRVAHTVGEFIPAGVPYREVNGALYHGFEGDSVTEEAQFMFGGTSYVACPPSEAPRRLKIPDVVWRGAKMVGIEWGVAALTSVLFSGFWLLSPWLSIMIFGLYTGSCTYRGIKYYTTLRNNLDKIVGMIGIGTGMILFTGMATYIDKWLHPSVDPQGKYSHSERLHPKDRKEVVISKETFKAQGKLTMELVAAVERNMARFWIKGYACWAFFIADRTCWIPAHIYWVTKFYPEEPVRLELMGATYIVREWEVTILEDREIVFFNAKTKSLPPRRNMLNWFLTDEQLREAAYTRAPGRFVNPDRDIAVNRLRRTAYADYTYEAGSNRYYASYTDDLVAGDIITQDGECGSVLMCTIQQNECLLGMHFGLGKSDAIFQMISREQIMKALQFEPEDPIPASNSEIYKPVETTITAQGVQGIEPLYEVALMHKPLRQTHYYASCVATKLISMDNEVVPVMSAPARGDDFDYQGTTFTPATKFLRGFNKRDDRAIPEKWIEDYSDYLAHLLPPPPKEMPQIWPVQECLNGFPFYEVKPIELSTSAGTPWKFLFKGGKGKNRLFKRSDSGEIQPRACFKPYLDSELHNILYDLTRVNWVYMAGFKMDETRPVVQKLDDNMQSNSFIVKPTRFLCGGNASMSVLYRRFFGSFSHAIHNNYRNIKGSIDAAGPDFHRHFVELIRGMSHGWAGDVTEFDTSCLTMFYKVFWRCSDLWYSIHYDAQEEATVGRTNVLHCDSHALLHWGKFLYWLKGILCTGNQMTFDWNSIRSDFMLFCYANYSKAIIMPNPGAFYYHNFSSWVVGDDFMTFTTCKGYGLIGYAEFCKEHFLITLTDPQKRPELQDTIQPNEAECLKRSAYWNGTMWVGLLQPSAIITQVMWLSKTAGDEPSALGANMNSALREFFLYGKTSFEHWRKQFARLMSRAGYQFRPITWDECAAKFLTR